jgi:ribose transport system substrate-binding protein
VKHPLHKLAALAVAGLALSACSTEADSTTEAADAGGTTRIVMLLNDQFDPYYLTLVKGAEEKAAELGVDFSWQAPTTLDVASQTQLLQSIASTNPDGIIMSALDADAMVAPMKQVQDSGIPIVTVDSDVNDESVRLATFKSDGKANGTTAADEMNELIGGEGSVGYVGYTPGIQSVDIRLEGWTEQLDEYPGITNEGDQYAGADISENASKASALLARVPDLKGIYASWTNASIGAANAVQQAGKSDDVAVIGVDASPDEVELLRSGQIDALMVQKPYDMGADALNALVEHAEGGADPESENLYDVVVATTENLDDPDVAKYLYVKPESE